MKPPTLPLIVVLSLVTAVRPLSAAGSQTMERIVVDPDFAGAYQVEVADVNGDKKPDIIAVGGSTCAWYENPTWKKRVVTGPTQTPGIISSATADLDGDGKAEIAVAYEFAMNAPTKGKLLLATQGRSADDAWTLTRLADVGSIHRLRFGDIDGDHKLDLVVAPIFGRDAKPPSYSGAAELHIFSQSGSRGTKVWRNRVVARREVMHAIEVIDADGDGVSDILTADNGGVILLRRKTSGFLALTPGSAGPAPKRGASEVHLGKLAGGRKFLATIEPWHGHQVAVCMAAGDSRDRGGDDARALQFSPRIVLDDTLADGHALWVADVDGDGDDEIFAGHRGKDHRVSLYDFDRTSKTWNRTVIDRDIAAQDLRGGDLDGDGTPDIVAVGGATHNVVWYRFNPAT
ncbi:MAG: FG-GAP repeat domain-containing protein [Isosphaeraceae bacterium]